MSTHMVPVAELPERMTDLLSALVRGERVQVTADGRVVAELVRPAQGLATDPATPEAAVAAIVADMISEGHPPPADSPLWRFVPRAA
jgi:antitoxin (DNA-binding transcriptional repressor) of toxin-antitoxin stability system